MSALTPVSSWIWQDERAGVVMTEQSPQPRAKCGESVFLLPAWPGWPGQWCRAGPPGCCTNPLQLASYIQLTLHRSS